MVHSWLAYLIMNKNEVSSDFLGNQVGNPNENLSWEVVKLTASVGNISTLGLSNAGGIYFGQRLEAAWSSLDIKYNISS